MSTPQDALAPLFDAPPASAPASSGDISHLFDASARPARRARVPATSAPAPAPGNPYGAFDAQTEGRWSINDAPKVREWFRQTYNRDLPVTAEGQSSTHNAMGLDHSDSVDVGVNPTSEEGKALRDYLRAQGIPFLAYDRAVPGAATAAHVHIGFPSHRGEAGEAARAGSIENLFDSAPDPVAHLFDNPDAVPADEDLGPPVVTTSALDGKSGLPLSFSDNGRAPAPVASAPQAPASAPLDLQTTEGRAARDETRAAAHLAGSFVPVPVPLSRDEEIDPGKVSAGEAVRRGVQTWAQGNGIPAEFVERWQREHAPSGYSLHVHEPGGAAAETLIDAGDGYDETRHAYTVKIDAQHLSKLKDDYDASKGTLQRASDWASSDMESPGEKVLDVAAPVAGAVGKVGGYVARPLQAVSAGVFAGLRGHNPLPEAGHTFTTGETSAAGSNIAGNFLRDSQTLNNINPRLSRLLGGAADTIFDPANLIGLGLAGKGARALAGAGRIGQAAEEVGALGRSLGFLERGLVEARPLGLGEEVGAASSAAEHGGEVVALEDRLRRVNETARKLRAGEQLTPEEAALHAEVSADASPSPAVRDEMVRYSRSRADYFTREAANAQSATARQNAQSLADEYSAEAARLSAPDGARPGVGKTLTEDDLLRKAHEHNLPLDEVRAQATGQGYTVTPAEPGASLPRRLLRTAVDVAQLPKAKAGFDLSATGRQGLAQILAHPSYFKDAMAAQVKSFASEDAFNSFVASIKGRPDYDLMRESGLYLSSAGSGPEEAFASGLVKKIPGVRGSEQAYSAALDSVRTQAWDNYTSAIADNPHVTPETHKAIADLINISTGRGVVPILDRSAVGKKIVNALNVPFFSPRNTASKFNLISPARIVRNALDPATRPVAWLQMRDATRGLAVLGTTLGLAHLAGADVGLNPFSNDFGKLRVGHAVYDLTGGEGVSVRYVAQMSRAFYLTERGKKLRPAQTPLALTRHYLRSQLQPAASAAVDAATGKTFEGQQATKLGILADLTVPFIVDDAYKGWVDAGGSSVGDVMAGQDFKTGVAGAARGVPGVFGVGVNFYAKKGSGSAAADSPADDMRSELRTQGLRESRNVEDMRGDIGAEVRRAGRPRISDAQAADLALHLDEIAGDLRASGDLFANVEEHKSLPRVLRPVGDAAMGVTEMAAEGIAKLRPSQAKNYRSLARTARAVRLLADEQEQRPAQFLRDAWAGRYGDFLGSLYAVDQATRQGRGSGVDEASAAP